MKFGPDPLASSFEGCLLVETISDDGLTLRSFESKAAVAKLMAPNCGTCCHGRGSVLVLGEVVNGKINGVPLRRFVPVRKG